MGTFLAVMFCLFIVVVFIALVILLGVAATAFGEEFSDYVHDASEEYFYRKRERNIKIKIPRLWSAKMTQLEVDLFGKQYDFSNVAEMVAWLKEHGVE